MNPDYSKNERAKLEAKLTALLLGELHASEVASLSKAMEKDPKLAALYERLKVTIELVREGAMKPAAQAPLKLSAEKREKLLASFKTVAPKEFAKPRRVRDWLVPMAACLAIAGILVAMLMPRLAGRTESHRAYEYRDYQNLAQNEMPARQYGPVSGSVYYDAAPREQAPAAPAATPPSSTTVSFGRAQQNDFSPATGLAPTVPKTSIVLPAGRGDVGTVPGQTIALGGNGNVFQYQSAAPADTSRALKEPSRQQTDLLVLNGGSDVPSRSGNKLEFEAGTVKPDVVNAGAIVVTNGFAPGAMAFNDQTSYRMLTQWGTDDGSGKFSINYKNVTNGIGDVVMVDPDSHNLILNADAETTAQMQKMIQDLDKGGGKEPELAQQFAKSQTGLYDRAVSNSPPGLAGGQTWAIDTHNKVGALTDAAVASNSSGFAVRQAYIAPPSASDGLLTAGLRGPTHVAGVIQSEEKAEIVLPNAKDFGQASGVLASSGEKAQPSFAGAGAGGGGGGFGGGGRFSGFGPASGGKQVELAAAANTPKLQLPESPASVGAKFVEVNSNDSGRLGFDWYLREVATNGVATASGGTMSEQEKRLIEARRGAIPPAAALERAKAIYEQNIQTSQLVQDGKLLYQLGKTDEAELKLNEALAQDASSQGAPYYLSLIKRARENDTALPKPAVPPPTPQPEVLTRENAFSTFSLNVSDVSFKLAAATLEKGQMPEPGSIRSEEFINAFDYRDPDAAPGVPIAFASERARYPFAHNRELLRFSLKTAAAGRQAGRPLNIVLLLDNSGSMERADRVTIIREALRVLAGQLQAGDTFSIVTFARTAQLRVDGIPGNQAAAAGDEIAKLTPEGGTNLGDALDLAYQTALKHYLANGDNRVVLLTDGAANLGDVNPDALKQKVEAHRKQGVALDCFGIGWEGYNDDLLETLTRNGDGRYGFINSPGDANTEFVAQIAGALHVAAADVKVQVEFNPQRVTSYRQIGYAKHQLTKEQFRDNTVDAAEISAQEAGNALYTAEINPEGSGSIATVRVRYKVPGTAEYREQAWDVPYTGGAVALDQASPAMRLASTACAFSEWLASSPFAAEVSTDELLKYISGVPQVYGADQRPAKLEWMIRQAKSISGK